MSLWPFFEEVLMSFAQRTILLDYPLPFLPRLCWASLRSRRRDVFSWLDDSWRWYFYNCSDWWAISGLIAWYNCSLLPKSLSVSMTAGYVCMHSGNSVSLLWIRRRNMRWWEHWVTENSFKEWWLSSFSRGHLVFWTKPFIFDGYDNS